MICPHCKTIHHICPECGGKGRFEHSRKGRGYVVYECENNHRWHEWNGEVLSRSPKKPESVKRLQQAR